MRHRPIWILSLALCLGCPAVGPTGPKPSPGGKASSGSGNPTVRATPRPGGTPLPGQPATTAAAAEAPRVLGAAELTTKVKLVGEVRLISDKGSGLVSNNGGTLVSNNGGTLVANNGGTLVANNGGTLVANNGGAFRLTQAAAKAEARLTDARIEVLDAAGRPLAGPDGKPIGATTDAEGRYRLEAGLPAENVVLRVRLHPAVTGAAAGGELRALLPRDGGAAERRVDVDTAAAVGATFVLDRLVQRRRDLYDRLATPEVEALGTALRSSLASLPAGATSYAPADLAAAAEAIRREAPGVDGALKTIEAILLAGQLDLGDGRPASEVALGTPVAAFMNGAGELTIMESYLRRIRQVGRDGRIRTLVGAKARGASAFKVELGVCWDMAMAPDGTLYVAEPIANRVRKIAPDGTVTVVAGDGAAQGPKLVRPAALALGPGGVLYVGEWPGYPSEEGQRGRIFVVKPDGAVEPIANGEPGWGTAQISGLACAADGTLYATGGDTAVVARKKPDAGWELRDVANSFGPKRLALSPDGSLLVAEVNGRRVFKYDFAGAPASFIGSGERGYDGDGGPAAASKWMSCSSVSVAADGRVIVADRKAGVVRAVDKAGIVTTIAGAAAARAEGDVLDVPVNTPLAAAIDPQGRVVVSEGGGHTVKRVEAGKLAILAGGGGDRDAAQARDLLLDHPSAVAFQGQDLLLCDAVGSVVRRIRPDGTTAVVAGRTIGAGEQSVVTARTGKATDMLFWRPLGLAVAPDGTFYFSDVFNNVVMRVKPDGSAEVVAGLTATGAKPRSGEATEGMKGSEAPLYAPLGLALDAAGNLYIADAGNYKIRKLDAKTGLITTYAGSGLERALERLATGELVRPGDKATDAFLAGPAGLAFDGAGNLYVSVLGTANLALAGDLVPLPATFPVPVQPSILRIAPDGAVTVVAGPGGRALKDPEADDALVLPYGVLIDGQGRLVVVDAGQNQVKAIPEATR